MQARTILYSTLVLVSCFGCTTPDKNLHPITIAPSNFKAEPLNFIYYKQSGSKVADFWSTSIAELKEKTIQQKQSWGLGNETSVEMNQDTGHIRFKLSDKKTVEADFQIVGVYSVKTGFYQWGWYNTTYSPQLLKAAKEILSYGQKNNLITLTTPNVYGDRSSWEFVAAAAKLTNASGAYRVQQGQDRIYILLNNLR